MSVRGGKWLLLIGLLVALLIGQWLLLPGEPARVALPPLDEASGEDAEPAELPEMPLAEAARPGEPARIALITERPLFRESRRPPEPEPEPESESEPEPEEELEPDPPDPLKATLEAVMGGADRRWIILRLDDSERRERLRVGDTIEDWTLDHIGTDSVRFTHGEATQALRLRDYP